MLSFMMRRNKDKNIDRLRIPEVQYKINPKWSHDELLLGVQGETANIFTRIHLEI